MKYIIPRGKDFYCEFVVKEPGASVPMDVTGATGDFHLSNIGVNPCLVIDAPIAVVDPLNGVVSITIPAIDTKQLLGRKGFAEDGFPLMPTYSGSLDMIISGKPVNVVIPKVYILDDGIPCPVQNP